MGKPITCKYCSHEFSYTLDTERKEWREKKYICPKCQIDYCILPQMERDLRKVQDDYIASNRSRKYLNKLEKLIWIYVEGMLKKSKYRNVLSLKRSVEMDDPLFYYTHKICCYFFDYYLKDENNIIKTSFGGYLSKVINWALYEKKEHFSTDLSVDYEYSDGSIVQFEDVKTYVIDDIENKEFENSLVKDLVSYVKELGKYCTPRENYIRLLMLNNYLSCGEKVVDRFFNAYEDKTGKLQYMQTLEFLKQEIKKMYTE